jgi:mannose-6-phosphate isomerase-like protein (cupin superfamily)
MMRPRKQTKGGGMQGKVIDKASWADPSVGSGNWRGEFEGSAHGAGISVIFVRTDIIGDGPRLHQHPYPETFIVRNGRVRFTVGGEAIEAVAGQIVVCPANVPHKFENLGPGLLEQIDIHEAGKFETVWLE